MKPNSTDFKKDNGNKKKRKKNCQAIANRLDVTLEFRIPDI